MKLWSLGSGSHGNALLLECVDSRILIDAGFPARVLEGRLMQIGISASSIDAVVLTHEHHDHVRGAVVAAMRWGWSVYASSGTASAFAPLREVPVQTFAAGATISLPGADIETLPVLHDAAAPIAVIATARATGARVAILYDLGCVTPALMRRCIDLDVLVLEANHDEGMLRAGPYPPIVQARIASRCGHLSNREAAAMAMECVNRATKQVVLAHISERCNDRAVAADTVSHALARTAFRGRVDVTMQHAVTGPFTPGAPRRGVATQLSLAL